MNLYDLSLRVGNKIGMIDAATIALIKDWADARHQMICTEELWKDLLSIYTFANPPAGSVITLHHQIARPVAARYDSTNLFPVDQVFLFMANPGIWDQTGVAALMTELPSVGVKTAPLAEAVNLVSTNAADAGKKVSLIGELAGVEKRETVFLNGLTPVISANAYDTVYIFSKETTAGTVTATGNTSAATLEQMFNDETERTHCRIRLIQTPTAALTLLVLGKRRPPRLLQDSDKPALRGVDNCLEAFVLADAYEWQRQVEDAVNKRQEAMALLAQLKQTEVFQAANQQSLVPWQGDCAPGEIPGYV